MGSRRGRGRGFTFDVKNLLGDDFKMPAPDSESQSSSVDFPPLPKMPIPLQMTPALAYQANIRQEAIDRCRSMFYIGASTKQGIERYRDRYKIRDPGRAYERKLNPRTRALLYVKRGKSKEEPQAAQQESKKELPEIPSDKDEESGAEGGDNPPADENAEEKDSDEEDPVLGDDEVEEEEMEQITDYISSYFDNGEDYIDDDDDKFEDAQAW